MFDNQINNLLNKNIFYNQNLVYDYFQEYEKIRDPKYKTELCKKFEETGKCPYGFKCRFAHGKEELNSKNTGNNYKKKSCKTFLENGFCPYGSRCSFKHDERTLNDIKLPYYYIKTFIYNNFNCNYRLNIFEEITSSNINNNNNNECFKNKDFGHINSSTTSTISIESEDNNF
jgi:hypothetical protein